MVSKHQIAFTEGPVARQLSALTLPMVWAILALMSFNAADTFFVAQLGDEPLAAMSFTFPVAMVLTSVAIGLGAGMSSGIARALGSGESTQACRLATDGVSLSLLISVFIAVLGWFSIEWIFSLLGAGKELLPLIREYMEIWYLGAPGLIAPIVCTATLRANGLSRLQSYIMIGSSLANILLDPILIFGLLGAPRLELAGAALATVIVRAFTLLVSLWIMRRVGILGNPFNRCDLVWQSWKAIFHVGVPATATNVIIPLSSAIVVALVAQYGSSAVAGYGVASRIEMLALICFYALSSIVGPFFGQNQGANKIDRLDEAARVILLFCLSWGLFLALVLWLFSRSIVEQFSQSAEIIQVAVTYLSIVPLSYGAYGLVMSINAAFNGLAKPMPGLLISTSRVLIIYLPLAFLGQWLWELPGLFVGAALANLISAGWGYQWLKRYL
ncbi:MATE family efflux transporter [Motiliproteus sp. MSK22-1]|uniref:MATE family efflux transporter n=1 Tax=Motiliproteus sp. MSK22-1 TaxID=1897630 RepID=UPI0009757491|nr:MATE family efflux transporter [Motiliproteus sp. MSK22-1]OMH30799.1 MATE family efflux transporter [Motiliproteus sp. MSK22-1]